jgi:hypothetical protein
MRQFFGALRPYVDPVERIDAYRYLDGAQRRIFESMTPHDQQHGIAVYRRIRAACPDEDPPLFTAALLHDCGKGHVGVWHRIAHVLLGIVPPLRVRLAAETGAPWRQALWRLLHHPALGADMVARTGADPETVRMIREQDARVADPRLALLQAADNA